MKKNQQFVKLFIVMFLCSAYVFGFSNYGAKAFGSLFAGGEGYLPGTAVGTINLEGKSPKEALDLLKAGLAEWQANTEYKLVYKEKMIELDKEQFSFDFEGTVTSLVNGRQNALIASVDESVILEWITMISPQLIGKEINLNDLHAKLVEPASSLQSGEVVIKLAEFIVGEIQKTEVISTGTVNVKEVSHELEMAVEAFQGITIQAGSEFSFLRYIENEKLESLSPNALSMMASAVYIAVLGTNFDLIERNISKELPEYSDLGSEARVEPERGIDFSFYNPNETEFKLDFEFAGDRLNATITGTPFLFEYKAVSEGKEAFKPKTIIQNSPLLTTGQVTIEEEGKEGKIITIYREVYSNGTLIDTVAISEDYYPPVPRVEIRALTAVQTNPVSPKPDGTTDPAPGTNPVEGNPVTVTPPPSEGASDPAVSDPSTLPVEVDDGDTPIEEPSESGDDGGLWGKPNEQPK
ncbi:G5 domain-containing protein [Bacillus sp. EB01]|uniref:G5 domain-containing protein n=1 Tax=Bacillus sp. EB01 TaxID=1347086 RepID=UPI0005C6C091|nr:G5 domain-containing protein [Bacillus sp. EB01]